MKRKHKVLLRSMAETIAATIAVTSVYRTLLTPLGFAITSAIGLTLYLASTQLPETEGPEDV
jgi:hypothetical protein